MAITKLSNSGIKTGQLKYDSLLAGNDAYYPADFFSIATTTVGSGGTSSVTFSSIPQTYKHLQLRIFAQASSSGTGIENCVWSINGDGTSTNYANHYIMAQGTGVYPNSSDSSSGYGQYLARIPQGTSNRPWTGMVIDILDYTNTNKNKVFRNQCGWDANGGENYLEFRSMVWLSTSAITSIKIDSSWGQYSSLALYGIKG